MPEKISARKKTKHRESKDLDIKIQFMEGIVRRDPEYIEALQLLGDHYTQRGSYDQGLRIDEKLSRLEPNNPLVFYNLACSYSLIGQVDLAAHALKKALTLGYRDFKWLARDPDLRTLRKDPVFLEIKAKIRKMNVKIA
jgi:tetratricopeptide (TPR) repeat protein